MKTKQTTALMMSTMLLTALIGYGKPIPISIDRTIPLSRSSKNKDTNFEDAANFINFGTVKGQTSKTVSNVSNITAKAAVIAKPSPQNNVKASAPTTSPKISKSRGKKNTPQLGSPSVDSLSPSSWVLSEFGTASVSGPVLNNQQTSGLVTLTGQTPAEPNFILSPPTIVSYPVTPSVQTVPDGGATALLLGLSLCGFGWLKRKSVA